jgi:hypothetical protein
MEASRSRNPLMLSFRDGPKDQTSDVQLHIGELEMPGSMLRIAPE